MRFAEPSAQTARQTRPEQDAQASVVQSDTSRSKGKEKEVAQPASEPAHVDAQPIQAQTPPQPQQAQQDAAPAPTAPSMVEPSTTPGPEPTPRIVAAANDEAPRGEKRTREKEPTTEARPRKAPKRSAVRSNAAVQEQVEGEGQAGPSEPKQAKPRKTPVRKPRKSAKDVQAQAEEQPQETTAVGGQGSQASVQPSKIKKTPAKRGRPSKPKTPTRVVEDEDAAAAQTGQGGDAGEGASAAAPKPKKPRKPRQKKAPKATAATDDQAEAQPTTEGDDEQAHESDPELHEIDPNAVSMYSLSREKRYGKTSETERKMALIDWDEVKRKRNEEIERIAQGVAQPTQRPTKRQPSAAADGDEEMLDGDEDGNEEDTQQAADTRPTTGGPTFRMVNGQLVLNDESTQIDRDAQARAMINADTGEVEEESDLTRFYNRTTHMLDRKRDVTERLPFWKAKSDPWNEEETDRFYDALRNWGTDFMIISQLFPGKTRMQVKKKFTREEKLDPERITAALMGGMTTTTLATDRLDAFALASNVPLDDLNRFESLEHANEIIAESMKDKEEAMRAAVAEEEEVERQRQVQLAQRKSAAEKREQKKRETQQRKMLRKKGVVMGSGTFGGTADGGEGEVVDGGGD